MTVTDDRDLHDLDPYDLMDAEAARLDAYFAGLDDATWAKPSRCVGWSVRDVLAHLLASEDYNHASLEGSVGDLLAEWGAKGATDLESANELGIRSLDDTSIGQLIAEWRVANAKTRMKLRERDGDNVDTSVGPYPARWQAFHLAFELAVHGDDVGVPVSATEADGRVAWEAAFGRFALKELDKDLQLDASGGTTHVKGDGIDTDLPDAVFVDAVAARLDPDGPLDAEQRALLSATP
jgi:uncharacterized protein (TIGR03083 family)